MRRMLAALTVVVVAGGPVLAAPKGKAARAEFDKGVAAYTKGDFAGASDALGKSYSLEADAETLFAWAQTERKQDHCDKAIELYNKLLEMKLPEENKDAVRVQIEECQAIIAAAAPPPEPDPPTTTPPDDTATQPVAPMQPEQPPAVEGSASWWKDPVGGALVGLGVVALGAGTVFMVQGRNAESDKDAATTYNEYESLANKAESRGRFGVIGLAAGGALVVGGVIWYATRGGSKQQAETVVDGWLAPSGGGFAVSGRF